MHVAANGDGRWNDKINFEIKQRASLRDQSFAHTDFSPWPGIVGSVVGFRVGPVGILVGSLVGAVGNRVGLVVGTFDTHLIVVLDPRMVCPRTYTKEYSAPTVLGTDQAAVFVPSLVVKVPVLSPATTLRSHNTDPPDDNRAIQSPLTDFEVDDQVPPNVAPGTAVLGTFEKVADNG